MATAIQGVSLDVPAGSIVALVGTNGAGKTTTLRAISGFLPSEDAEITDGEISFARRAHQRRACRTSSRKCRDHSGSGARQGVRHARACRRTSSSPRARARQITLERILGYFPRLARAPAQLAGYLSGGEKQMLAIGMALLCRPTLLLIDELSLGLAPIAIKELMESIAADQPGAAV